MQVKLPEMSGGTVAQFAEQLQSKQEDQGSK